MLLHDIFVSYGIVNRISRRKTKRTIMKQLNKNEHEKDVDTISKPCFSEMSIKEKNEELKRIQNDYLKNELKKYNEEQEKYWADIRKHLYFECINGVGNIYCRKCGFTEEITSFTHAGRKSSTTGYQCQSCGKFTTITTLSGDKTNIEPCYNCGGKLEREKPIFCPKCKSTKIKYSMRYCT